jgi:ubiquinone/menaquinone biosynthesis C-methylase UbiE
VAPHPPAYSAEPSDPRDYTARNDRLYSRFARVYDLVVKAMPVWRRWIGSALPLIRGPLVLEVSFGTGWLLTQYAGRFRAAGVDLNPDLFDTVVTTMAFTGYPDGRAAAAELARVLRPGGRLVVVDIGYPADGNRRGSMLVERFWKPFGDLVRDVAALLREAGLEVTVDEVGGWGSVHRYLAVKPAPSASS